jgi:hypothetical protein
MRQRPIKVSQKLKKLKKIVAPNELKVMMKGTVSSGQV